MAQLRVATLNIENLDFSEDATNPPLKQRIPVLRSHLAQLNADVLCLQEIHGQLDEASGRRKFLALQTLLETTQYANYYLAGTYDLKLGKNHALAHRNLVTLSRFPLKFIRQFHNDLVRIPFYQNTAIPSQEIEEIAWHRPCLHIEVELPNKKILHVINLHLKSPLPSEIVGQQSEAQSWQSLGGRAESELLTFLKRAGQALEIRMVLDRLFQQTPNAWILVCGDFNAELHELPTVEIMGNFSRVRNPLLVGQELTACEQLVAEGRRFTHIYLGKRRTIDHLLVSRSLSQRLTGCKIFNQALQDSANPDRLQLKFPESDHASILAVFQI